LNAVYPEHSWTLPTKKPTGHWTYKDNQKDFFDQLGHSLNIKQLDDWYKVNVKTVVEKGGSFINQYYNGSLIRGKSLAEIFD
jgi:hypothetical protein